MCYHKSVKVSLEDLTEHYNASFDSIHEELAPIKDKLFSMLRKDPILSDSTLEDSDKIGAQLIAYSQKNALPSYFSKPELSEMKWCLKTLTGFDQFGLNRYHENGFDFLSSPIITAGSPDEFKLFRWGLIPFFMTDAEKAMGLRAQTLNCISEEMYEKPSFRDAVKNGQFCLIPFKGCFEWRWLDEKGTIKVPYFIDFGDNELRSMAGLYSRWKDPRSGEHYYSYTILTTAANPMFEYIHNSKFRMPVFLRKEDEKAFLKKGLSKFDVLDLCQPSTDLSMRAHTITKLLTTRNINTNVPEVLARMDYNVAIREAEHYLKAGDRKKALEVFKNAVGDDKLKVEDLQLAALQDIKTELALAA